MAIAVTPAELVGVLVWWCVMLAAPGLLLRRWHRRRIGASRHRLWLWALRSRRASAPASRPQARPGLAGAPEQLGAYPASLGEPDCEARASAGALLSGGQARPRGGAHSRSEGALGASLSTETLEPLCRFVDFRRRLELAVGELERRLSALPADGWRIECYPLTGERRNTLLVLGESGVFVISATYAPGHWDDVITASTLARKVEVLLPGYRGRVQGAICHPFTSARPRLWHRPDEHGAWVEAWVLGGDSVIDWLEHFGTEHGVGAGDLERFDQLAEPDWLRPAIPSLPSWPPVAEAAQPGAEQ